MFELVSYVFFGCHQFFVVHWFSLLALANTLKKQKQNR